MKLTKKTDDFLTRLLGICMFGVFAAIFLGGLYLLVRFIHWAWTS